MMEARSGFLVVMILSTAAMRVVPYVLQYFGIDVHAGPKVYPWNFAPVTAMCLFGAAHFSQRRWSLVVPLLALFVSDMVIGLLMNDGSFALYGKTMPVVYACFALIALAGRTLQRHRGVAAIATAGLLGELLFYVVTNGAVWVNGDTTYAYNLTGLIECYVKAIPYFKHSLISTLLYSAVLFGTLAVAVRTFPALAREPSTIA